MGTPSAVGMVRPDGSIIMCYCNYDGYLEGVGSELLTEHNTQEAVENLFAPKVMFKNILDSVEYGGGKASEFTVERLNESHIAVEHDWEYDYMYLWKDGEWHYVRGSNLLRLSAILQEVERQEE